MVPPRLGGGDKIYFWAVGGVVSGAAKAQFDESAS